ncbi:hypothetical protein B296_00036870 [Ensete ventricosum]|uniref:Uncharacterized protein n=1 Tax=Ensete ventricosum TaxID=4639 RepID=A0A427A106_ENSVE|nr:hypothetical protein B296_00036870 [Ensete ventricosum]
MTNLEELSQLPYACRRLWRPVGSERREQRPRPQCEVSYVLGRLNLRTCLQKATPSSDPFTSSITMENMHLRTEISFDFALITEVYSRKTRHGDRGIGMVSMDTLKGYWSRPSERQTPPVKIKGERKQVERAQQRGCVEAFKKDVAMHSPLLTQLMWEIAIQ